VNIVIAFPIVGLALAAAVVAMSFRASGGSRVADLVAAGGLTLLNGYLLLRELRPTTLSATQGLIVSIAAVILMVLGGVLRIRSVRRAAHDRSVTPSVE
jgi:hypothetical protein